MRNFNFELRPADIIAQSNAAIGKMRENNEVLEDARRDANSYISTVQARELDSRGYRNIEVKMRDFKKVMDGLQLANDLDIADHNTLIGAVGTQNLIGSDIESKVNSAIRKINYYKSKIDDLNARIRGGCHCGTLEFLRGLGIAGFATSLGIQIAGGCTCINNDRKSRDEAIRLRDIEIDLRDYWLEKAAKYDRIEANTKNLFERGRDIRTEALRGIGIITQAADGLPNNYHHEELAGWRTSIAEAKNAVDRWPDLALMEELQLERFIVFDEFGNIIGYDWDAIEALLENQPIVREGMESLEDALNRLMPPLSEMDYRALAYVFSTMTNVNDVERFLQLMAVPFEVESGCYLFAFHSERMNRITEAGNILVFEGIFGELSIDESTRHQMMQNLATMSSLSGVRYPLRGETGRLDITVSDEHYPHYLIHFDFAQVNFDHGWPLLAQTLFGWTSHGIAITNVRYGSGRYELENSLHAVLNRANLHFLKNMCVSGKSFAEGVWMKTGDLLIGAAIGAIKIKTGGIAIPIGKAALVGAGLLGYAFDDPSLVRLRDELMIQFNQGNLSRHAEWFRLEAVAIWEHEERPSVVFYPTQETLNVIDNLNDVIGREEVNIEAFVNNFNNEHGTNISFDGELDIVHVLTFPTFAYGLVHYVEGGTPIPDPNPELAQ